MLNFNDIYILDDAFELEEKDNQFLYVDYENSNWFRTNDTGKMIFDKCNGRQTLNEIMQELAEVLGFPVDLIKDYMKSFLTRAIDRKVLLDVNEKHVTINTDFSDYPNTLWIHVSNRCNMMCPFCYSSSSAKENYNLNLEDILSFVLQIPEDKRKEIVISGGEPFLYKEIVGLVKGLNEAKFEITLITNGTVGSEMYPDVIPYISTFQVSCDGTTPKYYEYTRGKGNFDKLLKNIKLAKQCGMDNLVISFTPNKVNLENMGELPAFAYENNINHLHITRLTPAGRAIDSMEEIAPTIEEVDNAIKILADKLVEINTMIKVEDELNSIEGERNSKFISLSFARNVTRKVIYQTKITTCSLANGTLSINYDGYIYPCGNFDSEKFRLGSLKDNINDVMNRGKEFAFEHSVDNPKMKECYECKYKYFCGSGCRVCALAEGNIYGADAYCERTKKQINELMWNVSDNRYIV